MNFKALFLGEGRINRRQFIFLILFVYIANFLCNSLITYFFGRNWDTVNNYGAILFIIFWVTVSLITTSLILRRCHDIGINSYLGIIPCLYMFLIQPLVSILYMPLVMDFYKFNYNHEFTIAFLQDIDLWSVVIFFIYFIIISFIKGKTGNNKYGKEPKSYKKIKDIFHFWVTST